MPQLLAPTSRLQTKGQAKRDLYHVVTSAQPFVILHLLCLGKLLSTWTHTTDRVTEMGMCSHKLRNVHHALQVELQGCLPKDLTGKWTLVSPSLQVTTHYSTPFFLDYLPEDCKKMHLQRTAAPHYTTWGMFPSFSAPQLALGSGGRRWVAALAAYSPRALLSFPFCAQSTVLWPPPHNRRLEKQVTAWRCNLRCQRGSHSRLIGEPKTLLCCWGEENTEDPKNHMAPKGQQKSQSYTRQKLASASHGFGTYLSIQHEDSSTRMFSLMCSGHCFHTLAMYNKWKQ